MDEEKQNDLMAKLARLQNEFPEGFIFFIAPKDENKTWFGVFRFNPRGLAIVEKLYQKIVGQTNFTQN